MSKADKKHRIPKEPEHSTFLSIENSVSSTECTGLMPTPPVSDDEAESYTNLYGIHYPLDQVNNGLQRVKKTDENK